MSRSDLAAACSFRRIRTKDELKCFIEKKKIELKIIIEDNEQEKNLDDQKKKKLLIESLTKQIDYLSRKLLTQTGIVEDHLNGFKYFIADDQRLLGGGPKNSKAKDVDSFDSGKLCGNGGDKSASEIQNYLVHLTSERWHTVPGNNTCRILIRNKSRYRLFYKNCGNSSGFFFTDAISAFSFYEIENPSVKNFMSAKTGCGGILHCKVSDTACGSCGYVSVLVKTEGK